MMISKEWRERLAIALLLAAVGGGIAGAAAWVINDTAEELASFGHRSALLWSAE